MPGLIQPSDLSSALAAGGRPATSAQSSMLQAACDMAGGIVVHSLCNGRDFVRQVYTEAYRPSPDGLVFLRQIPVNFVSRIAAGRSAAITIRCLASVARASVAFTPGTLATDPPAGITLLSVSAGVATPTPIAFAGVADVGALGGAVSAVSGWLATVQPWASGLPCSDLVGAEVATPATGPGADIAAYADDIMGRLDRHAGILRLPEDWHGSGQGMADDAWWPSQGISGDRVERGSVLVTYDAGFDVIPPNVVAGTVLVAMVLLDRWGADFTIMSEDLGNTNYTRVSPELLGAIPKAAHDFLGKYRIPRA